MATLDNNERIIGVDIRGVLGREGEPDPMGVNGIYRVRMFNGKKYREKLAFYPYVITHTETQTINRSKFATAVSAWQALTSEQKAVYNKRAVGRHYHGYQLFIREFMLL